MFDSPSQMEPMLPSPLTQALEKKALDVVRSSAALGAGMRREVREPLVAMLLQMNSYYSNLIEGHYTHPRDIERALKKDFTAEPAQRALQIESAAHVEAGRRP